MRFNAKHKLLFLDPNVDEVSLHVEEKVNIILSPSLYWVKKVTLPINNLRDVKKLLPTLFEDTIPLATYSYSAYKSGIDSEYFIFAYEDKKILDLLVKQNIPISNVSSVHFAQSEFSGIKNAMKINERQSVYIKDDIVVLVPCCWIEEKGELDLSSITLSKHKVSLQQFGHIVEMKSFYGIASAMIVLILILGIEVFSISSKAQNIADKRDNIFSTYNLKPTMFENNAILKKYENIHNKQMLFRKYLSSILNLKLKKDEKMTLFNFKNNSIKVNFSGVLKNKTSHISSVLKDKGVKFVDNYKNGIYSLEIEL